MSKEESKIRVADCSDEKILEAVKGLAANMAEDTLLQPAGIVAWAKMAATFAAEINGSTTSFSIGRLHNTETGKEYGDWKCTLEKVNDIDSEDDNSYPKIKRMQNGFSDISGKKATGTDIFGMILKFDENTTEDDILRIVQNATDETGIEPIRFAIYGAENEVSIWGKAELILKLMKYEKK